MFQSCLLILFAMAAAAAPLEDWDNVTRLDPDATIEIRKADKTKLRGRFESATADSVTLHRRGGTEKVARSAVAEVRVRAGRSRRQHILIGAAIAGGWLFTVGAVGLASIGAFSSEDALLLVGAFGATGAVIGAGAGAVWPMKWRVTYRAK
jgi:hypothetical protein